MVARSARSITDRCDIVVVVGPADTSSFIVPGPIGEAVGHFVSSEMNGCRIRAGVATTEVIDALAPLIGEALGLVPESVEVSDLAVIARRGYEWGGIAYDETSRVVIWTIRGKFVADSYLTKLAGVAKALEALSDESFHFTHNDDSRHPDGTGKPCFFAPTDAARRRAKELYQVEDVIRSLPQDAARRAMAASVLRMIFDRDPNRMHVIWANTIDKAVDHVDSAVAAARLCRQMIADETSIAHVFDVVDTDATAAGAVSVDLDEEPADQVLTMGMGG